MGYTAEQESAIRTRGCELLVSAAAGSGKTAVLVERILDLITTASGGANSEPVDIDRLLVVTFTEAAANEMRQRLSAQLYARQLNAPADDNLQRQLMLLPRAQISTIHKFCSTVVRRYFNMTDIDPSFKIADETETRLLKAQLLDELFEEHYADDESFFRLVDYYGGGRTKDAGLHELVLTLSEFVSGFPWPEAWLTRAAQMYAPDARAIDDTPWAAVLKEELTRRLDGALATVEYAIGLAADGAQKYVEALIGDRCMLEDLRAWLNVSLENFRKSVFEAEREQLQRITKNDAFDPEVKERVQEMRNKEIKPVIKELRRLFAKPLCEMKRDIEQLHPIVTALCALTQEFMARYSEAKRRRNIADFSDLEQYALKVLLPDGRESAAAAELRERFFEVMTDEYQDSNLVQEIILSAVSRGNRFMVGDIKQSVYKFRGARPEIFMDKYKRFSAADATQAVRKIDLSKNFRSRRCVVEAVNMFFYQLMTADGGVEYDDSAALHSGADYPDAGGRRVSDETEVLLVDASADDEGDLSGVQLEAMVIASRINELVRGDDPLYVYDNGLKEYRRVGFRDIVILLRAIRGGVAEAFLDVLKKNGVPAFASTTSGYFESVEVMTVLSFLQIIDNPKQDIELLAVLRSPVYGLTDDELMLIREVRPQAMFYDCVREYAETGADARTRGKLKRFLTELERFRDEAVYMPISELIDTVYAATDYYNYVGAMAGGAVRQANLMLLREKAAQYEQTSYKGLFHFIGYMEKVKRKADEGDANALSENADLVRLMTVHKSKGLEFPVVFVSLLGRRFSRADERRSVILHEELGLGTVHMDLERRLRSNTLPRMAVVHRSRKEGLAEELRVLYVAMTRAREKLVLTGAAVNLRAAMERWSRYAVRAQERLPAHAIFSAGCFLDWVMPALMYVNRRKARVSVCERALEDIIELELDEEETRCGFDALMGADAPEELTWVYPKRELARLPAKLSISEIKRLGGRGVDADAVHYSTPEPVYERPKFLREKGGFSPAGKGTIMHTVLEHMDLSKKNGMDDLRALVAGLTAKAVLSAHEAQAVDYDALLQFNESRTMQRIIAAYPRVYRETPFVMSLAPALIYKRPELGDAEILVHGIIDCYFEEAGRLVLVDYKTGYVRSIDETLESYSLQMAVYKLALERAAGMEVAECLLYLFGPGKEVRARIAPIGEGGS